MLSIGAVQVHGQEPRLPAPADDALRKRGADSARARAVCRRQLPRERGVWQTVGAREPVIASLATRESIRALIAAGDLEPALERPQRAGHRRPSGSAPARRRCVPRRRRVRLRRHAVSPRAPGGGPIARGRRGRARPGAHARAGRQAARSARDVPRASAHVPRGRRLRAADAAARRLSSQLGNAEPLTEADYDAIVDRLAGVAAFRRAVDMQAEWLKSFPDSPRREEIESARVQHLYSLRANDEARASRRHVPEAASGQRRSAATSSSRSSGSTCAKGARPTSRSADARSWAARSPAPR